MAKKKTAVQETPVVDDGYRYRATFCPTWRTEVDCGEHDNWEAAESSIHITNNDMGFTALVTNWQQADNNNWSASGWDGQVETNLTIAKITRVAAE